MRCILIIAVSAMAAACGGGSGLDGGHSPPSPPATARLARTACGDYQGTDRGSTWSFLGIRFADTPTGARRWRSPESPVCPTATITANAYAPKCPQLNRATGEPEGDEDCLALNVFAPKTSFASGRVPVMVFIHGGGNVVVTVQYRLGPLGWLVHPALDAEALDARSGNYGLEDLVAALKWIQRDIGAFGGNKDRVMIFGQSAGGVNVCALLATPAAAGLFDAAADRQRCGWAGALAAERRWNIAACNADQFRSVSL